MTRISPTGSRHHTYVQFLCVRRRYQSPCFCHWRPRQLMGPMSSSVSHKCLHMPAMASIKAGYKRRLHGMACDTPPWKAISRSTHQSTNTYSSGMQRKAREGKKMEEKEKGRKYKCLRNQWLKKQGATDGPAVKLQEAKPACKWHSPWLFLCGYERSHISERDCLSELRAAAKTRHVRVTH